MEKEILLVGATERVSKKDGETYFIVEYVDFNNNVNKSLVKKITDIPKSTIDKIKSKIIKGNVVKVTGIFEINQFDRAELVNIK